MFLPAFKAFFLDPHSHAHARASSSFCFSFSANSHLKGGGEVQKETILPLDRERRDAGSA